jgi:cell division protein FtsB
MSRVPFQVIAVLAFALTLFFVWDLSQRIVTNVQLTQTEQQLERAVASAKATRDALAARKAYVASPDFAEEEARKKWNWIRDGETLVITQITPAPTPPPSAPVAPTPKPEIPWWQSWIDLIFGP